MAKTKGSAGRPFKRPESLIDFRITVSFPRCREDELREQAERQGLNLSSFVRQAVLNHMEKLNREAV